MISRSRVFHLGIAFTAAMLLLLASSVPVRGQALSKLKIGDDSSRVTSLGSEPVATDSYKSFTMRKWTLANGNDLSVTTSASGTIVFLESDWNGRSDDPACDLPGFQFGVTTLSDLRKRFGSNGFEFQNRGGVIPADGGMVLLNSYEVGKNVVTFITEVSEAEYQSYQQSRENWVVADHARLDAISIADAEYASSEWGERIYDPNYKKIIWK